MEVMYYNAEWLAELKAAGKIDFDGAPQTPEQFKAAACAATENPFSKAVAEGSIGYELTFVKVLPASLQWLYGLNPWSACSTDSGGPSSAGAGVARGAGGVGSGHPRPPLRRVAYFRRVEEVFADVV